MSRIIKPNQSLIRPQTDVLRLDIDNPLTQGCTYLSNFIGRTPRNIVNGTSASWNPSYSAYSGAGIGKLGRSLEQGSGAPGNILITSDADTIIPQDKVTIVYIREMISTALIGATDFNINSPSAGAYCMLSAPFTSGDLYWRWGNNTAGDGTIVISGISWTTGVQMFAMVAGPGKGREVWLNGNKIGSHATSNTRNSSAGVDFRLGGLTDATRTSRSEHTYMLGIFRSEWSDAQIKSWFANPYQLFAPKKRVVVYFNADSSLTQSARFDNSNTFYSATVSPGEVALTQSSRFDNSNAFYAATVSGEVTVTQSARFDNAQSFYSATVSVDGGLVQSSRFDNSNTFYSHTITVDPLLTQSARFDNSNTFYNHTLTYDQALTQSARFDNSNTFYSHSVFYDQALVQSARFDNTNLFYSPSIHLNLVQSSRFDNTNTFYTHRISHYSPYENDSIIIEYPNNVLAVERPNNTIFLGPK